MNSSLISNLDIYYNLPSMIELIKKFASIEVQLIQNDKIYFIDH